MKHQTKKDVKSCLDYDQNSCVLIRKTSIQVPTISGIWTMGINNGKAVLLFNSDIN